MLSQTAFAAFAALLVVASAVPVDQLATQANVQDATATTSTFEITRVTTEGLFGTLSAWSSSNANNGGERQISHDGIEDPVVFVSPTTYNGNNALVVRAEHSSVATDKLYSLKLRETRCGDNVHGSEESADWAIFGRGGFSLGGVDFNVFTIDGVSPNAGEVELALPAGITGTGKQCIAYLQSRTNDEFLRTRIKSVQENTITVKVESDEKRQNKETTFSPETLGFLCFPAVQPGAQATVVSDLTSSHKFFMAAIETTEGSLNTEYEVDVGDATRALSVVHSINGNNPVIIRHTSMAGGKLKFKLQEDTCNDSDNFHLKEEVVVFAF